VAFEESITTLADRNKENQDLMDRIAELNNELMRKETRITR